LRGLERGKGSEAGGVGGGGAIGVERPAPAPPTDVLFVELFVCVVALFVSLSQQF
jgi:hypothetical protein